MIKLTSRTGVSAASFAAAPTGLGTTGGATHNLPNRDLTDLEYAILGLIGTQPQSGYSLISWFEHSLRRRGASAGSIYPTLKRLEQAGIIAGALETTCKTHLRKVYSLTAQGETLLDNWLRQPLTVADVLDNHEVTMSKFLFAEYRLPRHEVLAWLDSYQKCADMLSSTRHLFHDMATGIASPHQRLINEATLMELRLCHDWIRLARQSLENEPETELESAARSAEITR
jgi:PadR family transcriptional regulator AphA